MGNSANCRCDTESNQKRVQQITFYEFDSCPMGMINQNSIKYLTLSELELFKLSCTNNITAFRLILSACNNPTVTDINRTSLLHSASRMGCRQILEELVKAGCNLNLTDISGWTPMHIAVETGRNDLVKLLLKHGANPYIKNKNNHTAYQMIDNEQLKQLATVRVLKQHNQLQESIIKQDFRSLRDIYQKNKSVPLYDNETASIDAQVQSQQSYNISILQQRKKILNLWTISKKLQDFKSSPKKCTMNMEAAIFLLEKFPNWGKAYLFQSGIDKKPEALARFFIQNRSKLKNCLLECLNNYQLMQNWDVAYKYLEMMINPNQPLFMCIEKAFEFISLAARPFELAYICEIFSRVYSKNRNLTVLQIGMIHNLVFCLMIQNLKKIHKINVYPYSIKSYIKIIARIIDLQQKEILRLISESESRKMFKLIEERKAKFQTVKIKDKVGQLYQLLNGYVFITNQSATVFNQITKLEYSIVELRNTESVLIDQVFQIKDINKK